MGAQCCFERTSACAAFTYGVILGQLATKDLAAVPIAEVPAVQWKSKFALRGTSKDDSRALAATLFPDRAADFRCGPALKQRFEYDEQRACGAGLRVFRG